jgi:hypothetical protein
MTIGLGAACTMFVRAIPNPDAMLMTRWDSDPFAHGSYTHIATGATPEDCDILAALIGDRPFFC